MHRGDLPVGLNISKSVQCVLNRGQVFLKVCFKDFQGSKCHQLSVPQQNLPSEEEEESSSMFIRKPHDLFWPSDVLQCMWLHTGEVNELTQLSVSFLGCKVGEQHQTVSNTGAKLFFNSLSLFAFPALLNAFQQLRFKPVLLLEFTGRCETVGVGSVLRQRLEADKERLVIFSKGTFTFEKPSFLFTIASLTLFPHCSFLLCRRADEYICFKLLPLIGGGFTC